jgi:cobalt-zinc-cadmium efflux system protein
LHSHDHSHATGNLLKWSLAATFAFVAVEAFAGFQAHSLALISDAVHNFTDGLALLLAWIGLYLQSKPADETRTYGYHRAGVLTAVLNAAALVLLSGWILYQSALRLSRPQPVQTGIMMAIAALGLILNGGITWVLRRASREDINIRGAFLHMFGDALGSAAIIAGAIVIRYTGWDQVDPALSILIEILIVWTAWGIIRQALNILLEGLPSGLQLQEVTTSMRAVDGVLDVHDLHIWCLGSSTRALSCHVLIDDVPPSKSDGILHQLNAMLAGKFRIGHTTVQFEHVGCAISENGCAISAEEHQGHQHA